MKICLMYVKSHIKYTLRFKELYAWDQTFIRVTEKTSGLRPDSRPVMAPFPDSVLAQDFCHTCDGPSARCFLADLIRSLISSMRPTWTRCAPCMKPEQQQSVLSRLPNATDFTDFSHLVYSCLPFLLQSRVKRDHKPSSLHVSPVCLYTVTPPK